MTEETSMDWMSFVVGVLSGTVAVLGTLAYFALTLNKDTKKKTKATQD